MAAAADAMTEKGHCVGSLQAWYTLPIEMRQPVSPRITTRLTTGFGSGNLMPATVALAAPAGMRNSQVVDVKTDGFELLDVCAAASVVSVLVGRTGIVAGSARTVMGLVTLSTVIAGHAVYGVMRRAMAWLLAPISTHAESPRAASDGQSSMAVKVSEQAGSPSETVSVAVTAPGAVQVSVGFCAEASLSVPELATQWYVSGCGPLSGSSETEETAMVLPVGGVALTESTCGQTLIVPLMRTLPFVWARVHEMAIDTGVVDEAMTANEPEAPVQLVVPSVAVPLIVTA